MHVVDERVAIVQGVLRKFSIKKFLIPFLFCFFIISFFTPLLGLIFSGFVAYLCLIIPLLKRPVYLPVAFIILFISNVFDPTILFVQSPFHVGILEFITPSQLFGVGATVRICFDVLVKIQRLGRISAVHMTYIILFAISIASSLYGVLEDNERMLQSLLFFFNISVCLWFYEFFLNLEQLNIIKLKRLLIWLGVASLFLFLFKIENTHIKFLFISLNATAIYFLIKSKKYYWYLLIPPAMYIFLFSAFYQSLTTWLISLFAIGLGTLSLKKTLFTKGVVYLIIIIVIIVQALIFSLAFIENPIFLTLDLNKPYEGFDPTKDLIYKISYKFYSDRLPLWLGAINGIKDQLLFAASGSSYMPINYGTFSVPERQIQWVAGAHQFNLELMVNYGFIGAVIYWSIWLSFMRKLFSAIFSKNNMIKFLSVSLLAYFIPASFVGNFIIQEHAFAAWALMGITMALHKRDLYFNKINLH
jgi:hypothetical protein